MDNRLKYPDIIKKILQEHAQYRASPVQHQPKFYFFCLRPVIKACSYTTTTESDRISIPNQHDLSLSFLY
ncbi:MAG: hypothetical protein WA919_26095 [Coleofasciculaceae cyanobacterium]